MHSGLPPAFLNKLPVTSKHEFISVGSLINQQVKNRSDYISLNITVLIVVTKYSFKVSKVFYIYGIKFPPQSLNKDMKALFYRDKKTTIWTDGFTHEDGGEQAVSRDVFREELKKRRWV